MPDEDYFDESGEQPGMAPSEKEHGKEMEDEHEGKTVMVNSEVCPGLQPGNMLNLRVVAAHGEEYECEYAGEDEEHGEEPEKPMHEGMEGGGDSEMSSMME